MCKKTSDLAEDGFPKDEFNIFVTILDTTIFTVVLMVVLMMKALMRWMS